MFMQQHTNTAHAMHQQPPHNPSPPAAAPPPPPPHSMQGLSSISSSRSGVSPHILWRLVSSYIQGQQPRATSSTSSRSMHKTASAASSAAAASTTVTPSSEPHSTSGSELVAAAPADSSTSSTSTSSGSNRTSSSPSSPSPAVISHNSLDKREAAKFAALADKWWDTTSGPFAALHALNTARCSFLRQGLCDLRALNPNTAEPLAGLRVLDVGCGGGLLSEPVARMGAQVTGIDVSPEGVSAAAAHAAGDPLLTQRITYKQSTLEDLVAGGASFDVVMASEVIEHVKQPQQFMASLAAATAPGGQVFVTTLNRTPASYALAIVGAEYLLRLVPTGTHSWTKFVTPQELAMIARDAGLRLQLLAGMVLQPSTGQFSLSDQNVAVNYAVLLRKEQQ